MDVTVISILKKLCQNALDEVRSSNAQVQADLSNLERTVQYLIQAMEKSLNTRTIFGELIACDRTIRDSETFHNMEVTNPNVSYLYGFLGACINIDADARPQETRDDDDDEEYEEEK